MKIKIILFKFSNYFLMYMINYWLIIINYVGRSIYWNSINGSFVILEFGIWREEEEKFKIMFNYKVGLKLVCDKWYKCYIFKK